MRANHDGATRSLTCGMCENAADELVAPYDDCAACWTIEAAERARSARTALSMLVHTLDAALEYATPEDVREYVEAALRSRAGRTTAELPEPLSHAGLNLETLDRQHEVYLRSKDVSGFDAGFERLLAEGETNDDL